TETCVDLKDRSCVDVCPVDCIIDGGAEDRLLVINPDECIDCGACVDPCPVAAIYPEDEVPAELKRFIPWNFDYFTSVPDKARVPDDRNPGGISIQTAEPGSADVLPGIPLLGSQVVVDRAGLEDVEEGGAFVLDRLDDQGDEGFHLEGVAAADPGVAGAQGHGQRIDALLDRRIGHGLGLQPLAQGW